MRHVTLITTGGTIEKTFDETSGTMENRGSIVRRMTNRLRLEGTQVHVVELMSKDSLLMTDDDRTRIIEAVRAAAAESPGSGTPAGVCAGVIVLHGTDTLSVTGERLHSALSSLKVPVILTGAMRPYEMKRSDALQNLTESIFATGVLAPGVYCVAHGRALRFPGVVKDRALLTFVKPGEAGDAGR